jgi:phosphoribosylformylglycinamidine synthase
VVSGNVSLYNETVDGPILPTPVIGTVGLLDDRAAGLRMGWRAGEELWLIGESADDADALAASELAWRRGLRGGRPTLDVAAASRVVRLLPRLARHGVVRGAHDLSTGGLGVALGRMAITSGVGARITLEAAQPTATLFGERAGRAVLAVDADRAGELAAALEAAGVSGRRIGHATGTSLRLAVGTATMELEIDVLRGAWATPF